MLRALKWWVSPTDRLIVSAQLEALREVISLPRALELLVPLHPGRSGAD